MAKGAESGWEMRDREEEDQDEEMGDEEPNADFVRADEACLRRARDFRSLGEGFFDSGADLDEDPQPFGRRGHRAAGIRAQLHAREGALSEALRVNRVL